MVKYIFGIITVLICLYFIDKKETEYKKIDTFVDCIEKNKNNFDTANELDCFCNEISKTEYGNFNCE